MLVSYPLKRKFPMDDVSSKELLLNTDEGIVLLIDPNQKNPVLESKVLQEAAVRGLLTLLIFQECPDEYLLAGLACPLPLLVSMLNDEEVPPPEAFQRSADFFKKQALKENRRESEKNLNVVKRAMSSLTTYLPAFGLKISRIISFGYSLLPIRENQTSLKSQPVRVAMARK